MSGPADPETLSIVTDVGSAANALAAIFKAGDDLFNVLNSPQMLAIRKSAAIQAELVKMDSSLLSAQKTGDLLEIDREASG